MIRRAPRTDHFTVLPNDAIEDRRLSFRARGILAYVLSKPDHWRTNSHQLATAGTEGRDAIRKALGELQVAGYARLAKHRREDGTFTQEWVVTDDWKSATGAWESDSGKPGAGFPGPLVKTEQQRLSREEAPEPENQLVHLRAVKDQLRHTRGEAG